MGRGVGFGGWVGGVIVLGLQDGMDCGGGGRARDLVGVVNREVVFGVGVGWRLYQIQLTTVL